MATKPVEILIREGLKAEECNDDVLGRTLDKLYRVGPEGIFMQIAANAYGEIALSSQWHHLNEPSRWVRAWRGRHRRRANSDNPCPGTTDRTWNSSLFLWSCLTTCPFFMSDNLPVFIQALSGNTSDKNHFREIVKEYGRSLHYRIRRASQHRNSEAFWSNFFLKFDDTACLPGVWGYYSPLQELGDGGGLEYEADTL